MRATRRGRAGANAEEMAIDLAIAVLFAGVLFLDRPGQPRELWPRLYQIALAITLAGFVVALGAAAFPVEDIETALFSTDEKSPVRWLVIGVVDEHEPGVRV